MIEIYRRTRYEAQVLYFEERDVIAKLQRILRYVGEWEPEREVRLAYMRAQQDIMACIDAIKTDQDAARWSWL